VRYATEPQHRPNAKVVGADTTYVNALHPLFFLRWLYAHEQLWKPHVRTKVANRPELAVVPRLRRYQ
jgi:hypothetical protein